MKWLILLLVPLAQGQFLHADSFDDTSPEWPNVNLVVNEFGEPEAFWINKTVRPLWGGEYNESTRMIRDGDHYVTDAEHPQNTAWLSPVAPMDGLLRWSVDAPWGFTAYEVEGNGSYAWWPDQHNPYNVAVNASIARPSDSPRVTAVSENNLMEITGAWTRWDDAYIVNTMELAHLDLHDLDCDRQSFSINLIRPTGSTQLWSHFWIADNMGAMNILVPGNEVGFIAVSDAHAGRIDITKEIRIMEGSPGRIEWVLDAIHWHDGFEGPAQLEATAVCDGEAATGKESPLFEDQSMAIGMVGLIGTFVFILGLAAVYAWRK